MGLVLEGYSWNPIPQRSSSVGETTLSKDDPLSVDHTMFTEAPTATNFPPEEEDEEDVVVVLSVVVEVVEEPLSLLLHEMTVRLI